MEHHIKFTHTEGKFHWKCASLHSLSIEFAFSVNKLVYAKWSLGQSLLFVVVWNVGVLQKSGRYLSFLLLGVLISSSSWGEPMLVIGSDVMPGVKTQIRSAS